MAMGAKWYVRRCAIGTGVAMGVYLLTLALCAYLTARGIVDEGQMAHCVWLCALLASFTGAILGGGKTVRRGAMTIWCGAVFYLAIILPGILVGGKVTLAAALHLLVPVALGGVGALTLLGGNGNGRKRGKHPRRNRW